MQRINAAPRPAQMMRNKATGNFIAEGQIDGSMRMKPVSFDVDVAIAMDIKRRKPKPATRVGFNENLIS